MKQSLETIEATGNCVLKMLQQIKKPVEPMTPYQIINGEAEKRFAAI